MLTLSSLTESILNAAGEGIYGLNLQGEAIFVNPAAEAMTGWSAEDLLGATIHYKHHHSHADGSPYPHTECPIYAAINDGEVHHVEDELFWRKDGSSFPVEYTSTPLYDQGKLAGAVVVFKDISERKEQEKRLLAAFKEVESLQQQLQAYNSYLQEEIRSEHNFGQIIGSSPALLQVLRQVEQVAQTDASVLIYGESGTGKELIARAIHDRSPRHKQNLVKLNCGAIASGLVESELFGHEKGAFTHAEARRQGRFELADRGTLFLDEIGELALETQVKLLRVLQEQEFERVGGQKSLKVDVRIIAATHRDLGAMIQQGSFREDLFYRINLFPIQMPALRERREDIPLLAQYFFNQAQRKFGKTLKAIRRADMDALQAYDWPGNIRELQNLIERAVILATGPLLEVAHLLPKSTQASAFMHLAEVEKAHIRRALELSKGVIAGEKGAAALLGLHPNTLRSRLEKWQIEIER